MRLVIGISGASGVVLAVELLRQLKASGVETHLIMTRGAELTIKHETNFDPFALNQLADKSYGIDEIDASIASGSFVHDGMIIVPCSMKTIAGIASGYSENLLLRAADICIKEHRKLIVVPREIPLSRIHLRNMLELAECGAIVLPPMLTFYNVPHSIQDQIDHIVGKILLQFGLPASTPEWDPSRREKMSEARADSF